MDVKLVPRVLCALGLSVMLAVVYWETLTAYLSTLNNPYPMQFVLSASFLISLIYDFKGGTWRDKVIAVLVTGQEKDSDSFNQDAVQASVPPQRNSTPKGSVSSPELFPGGVLGVGG